MKRQDVMPGDRALLIEAAKAERAARLHWSVTLRRLTVLIVQASRHGASLRMIATTIGRSHGRVRDLLKSKQA